jgi:hypothetical protein
LTHDYYDIHNAEMQRVADIDHGGDVEMMMMVVEVVHRDQPVLDIVYQMLVMIDHVVVELVEIVVQFED